MKTILMSGATGFLGTKILEKLQQLDVFVIALEEAPNLIAKTDKVLPLEFDQYFNYQQKHNNMVVLHLACPRKSDAESVMGGISFTHRFITHAAELGATTIVESSSQSVYDPYRTAPAVESDMALPANLYAVAKFYSEKWIQDFCDAYNMKALHLRLASLVGPAYKTRLTHRLVEQAQNHEVMHVNDADIMSFLHISDCVDAVVKVLMADDLTSGAYNLGANDAYTLVDICKEIKRQLDPSFDVAYEVEHKTQNVVNRSIDSSKFNKTFDFDPQFGLAEIIAEEVAQ